MTLQVLLFSLTPRLYFTRIVLISSLILFIFNLQWLILKEVTTVIVVLLYSLIFVHHIASLRSFKFFYGIFDLILIFVEIVGVALNADGTLPIDSWFPETLIFPIVLAWATFGSLILLAIFRLATIIRSRGRALVTPFDILSNQSPSEKQPTFFARAMGRSLWRANFVGETRKVIIIRGLLGLLFFAIIFFWALTSLIYDPMKETALGPVKELRSKSPPLDVLNKLDYPIWNILFPVLRNNSTPLIAQDDFDRSVDVLAIWDDSCTNLPPPACTNTTSSRYFDSPDDLEYTIYQIQCAACLVDTMGDYLLPNVLITVDFTSLGVGPTSRKPTSFQTVFPVVIGLTDSVKNIMEQTVPTVLIPGINIAAPVVGDFRQIFTHSALAALGLFQLTTIFWIARIVGIYPDPLVEAATNTSTLRLFAQINWSDSRITQDYRQSSVIAGFSAVGGLWTSLSGVFTIIFGATILHILYGSKPLSIFGVAHSFQYQHMKEETLRLYPGIIEEHKNEDRRGLLALLRDHLIDLSFLEREHGSEPKPNADIEQPSSGQVEEKVGSTITHMETDYAGTPSPSISISRRV